MDQDGLSCKRARRLGEDNIDHIDQQPKIADTEEIAKETDVSNPKLNSTQTVEDVNLDHNQAAQSQPREVGQAADGEGYGEGQAVASGKHSTRDGGEMVSQTSSIISIKRALWPKKTKKN